MDRASSKYEISVKIVPKTSQMPNPFKRKDKKGDTDYKTLLKGFPLCKRLRKKNHSTNLIRLRNEMNSESRMQFVEIPLWSTFRGTSCKFTLKREQSADVFQ